MENIVNLSALRDLLEARKRDVADQIRHYPGPIPGCDAQYNHLLDIRRVLTQELRRLDAGPGEDKKSVDDFLGESSEADILLEVVNPR